MRRQVTARGLDPSSPLRRRPLLAFGVLATGGTGVEHHEGALTRGRSPGPRLVSS